MRRCAQVQLHIAQHGREYRPHVAAQRSVFVVVQRFQVVGKGTSLHQHRAALVLCREAHAPLEPEGIGKGGALHERVEPARRQFLERLEVVVLPHRQAQRPGIVGEDRIGHLDFAATGEVRLELVAEPARDIALNAQPDTTRLVGKAQPVVLDAVGRRHVTGIVLQAAARLEAPAPLALDLRRALPRDAPRTGIGGFGRGIGRTLGGERGRFRVGVFQLGLGKARLQRIHPRIHRLHLGAHGGEFGAQRSRVILRLGRRGEKNGGTGGKQRGANVNLGQARSPSDLMEHASMTVLFHFLDSQPTGPCQIRHAAHPPLQYAGAAPAVAKGKV